MPLLACCVGRVEKNTVRSEICPMYCGRLENSSGSETETVTLPLWASMVSSTSNRGAVRVRTRWARSSPIDPGVVVPMNTFETLVPPEFATSSESGLTVRASPHGSEPTAIPGAKNDAVLTCQTSRRLNDRLETKTLPRDSSTAMSPTVPGRGSAYVVPKTMSVESWNASDGSVWVPLAPVRTEYPVSCGVELSVANEEMRTRCPCSAGDSGASGTVRRAFDVNGAVSGNDA